MLTLGLTFGVNPFDRCPTQVGRYHVIDVSGFIRAKSDYGFTAEGNAAALSYREPGRFSAIDTRDGSTYAAYCDGEELV